MCGGEGNGNPLQCSCLENPRGGGAWWAAVSGVAQSRTLLKQLSSSRMCGQTESKLTVNWKQKNQQSRFLLNPRCTHAQQQATKWSVRSSRSLWAWSRRLQKWGPQVWGDLPRWLLTLSPALRVLTTQFSSVQLLGCVWLCDPMDCSTLGFPVLYQLPELAQTHVHRVSDAIQPFHPLLSPSPPAFNLSQHQYLFQWVSSSHQVARALEFTRLLDLQNRSARHIIPSSIVFLLQSCSQSSIYQNWLQFDKGISWWSRICPSTIGVMGSIPSWGTKITQTTPCGKKKKEKEIGCSYRFSCVLMDLMAASSWWEWCSQKR